MTRSLILLGILVAFGLELRAAAEKRTVPNYGQLQTAKFNNVRNGFAQPDLLYAPFAFWFWDEPVEGTNYPGKTARMAKDLLEQGINPGYAHPRVSMADYQAATGKMVPSPSLPREQWLSKPWFDAFEDALQQAELRRGCFGYCDEYMWPSGRAAGRVMQKHPELANASLEWEVTDVAGGTQVEMSASFFSVAAQLDQKPDVLFSIPFSTNSFPLADLIGVDLFGHESLGQTVTVERERLVEISLERACWKEASKGRLKAEVRLAGPEGRLLASQYLDGGIGRREIALPIAELLPVGTVLYVAVIPGPGFPQNEVGWWCKTNDVYAGGNAFANGKLVAGDRHVKLSYRLKPDLIQGNWIWHSGNVSTQHTCFFRKSFELNPAQMPAKALARVTADNRYKLFINGVPIGQGEDWSKPGSYDVTSALHSGRNIVGLEAGGDGGLDAVLFDLKLAIPGGEELHVSSDGSWLFSRSPGEGWNREGFDDMAWQTARVVASADAPPWNLSAARLPYRKALIRSSTLQLIGSGDKFSWTAPSNGYWRIYTFKKAMGGDVNMLDHRLAAAFIEIAHKPYADRFGGRMGKSIPGVFCDTEGSYGANLPWSESLAPHYRAKTGRDVRLYMPLMLDVDVEGVSARARFDWFEAVSDLYAGYFAEIDEWLRSRGMYYISNLWEENLLWVTCVVGDPMKLHRAFSMPGMDCLFKSGYDVHDFKEVSSVAEFEGRRMMTEMMGAAGWNDFNPITVKEISNCLFAWGVSHVVPHGVFMSRGLEGNPWLPDWYDRNPMWSKMHLWSDFIRRASYVNSHGSAVPDVLMLTPITSVWTLMNADDLWGPNGSGNLTNLKSQPESMAKHIEWVYSDAIRALAEYRIQYLISDRHYVNQMRVDGPELVRGGFRFKTVVLPPLAVLPLDVAHKIVDFAMSGGRVYTLGALPSGSTDNGLHDPAMADLMRQLQAQPTVKACPQGLAQELKAESPGLESPLRFVSGEFPMLQLRRRIDNRDFFWLVNNSDQPRQCVVAVANVIGGASVWDCETGKIHPVASSKSGNGSQLQLAFQPHQAYWLVFDPQQSPRSKPIMALPTEQELLPVDGTWTVRMNPAVQPNLEHAVKIPEKWTAPAGVAHQLTLWDTWPEAPGNFSGLLDYTKTVTLPNFNGILVLDLGKVNHFAEVWVNGKHVGAKLWPPHKFQTGAFRPGNNEIRIRVGNLVNNNYNIASPSGLVGPVSLKIPAP